MAVYFIQSESGDVKIGRSKDPMRRLRYLQAATPSKLEIIRVIDGGRATERWLHEAFADQHLQGEWFKFDEYMTTVLPPEEAPAGGSIGPITQARYIVDRFGGMRALARVLGHANVTTVQGWIQSGYIPPRRYPEILKAARANGVALQPEDFVRHLVSHLTEEE